MPKQKITKEMVVEAAFDLARDGGMEQVLVKNLAKRLGCSVQPIYSYCRNMEGLRWEVTERAAGFVRSYVAGKLEQERLSGDSGKEREDLFRSTGRAYLQLAGEEPHIFRIFTLHRREGISSMADLYRREADFRMAEVIGHHQGISTEQAEKLHLHMLVYTIGLGTIFSVCSPGIGAEEMTAWQDCAYEAFSAWMKKEENDGKDSCGL